MITTFQALGVAFVALMPGAAYTFAYEREAGAYGVNLADRLVRFFVASAVLHAVFSGTEYWLIQTYRMNSLSSSDWWIVQLVSVFYIGIPIALGLLLGWGARTDKDWAARIVGSARFPRAWDYLWSSKRRFIVRAQLKSGHHVAGIFEPADDGANSYAAGYGEDADIYLARQLVVDPETGQYSLKEDGSVEEYDPRLGLLLRASEVELWNLQEIIDG